ncbi:alkaline exonuclease [Neodiprion abietis nucleopolyhedrovirus]|uniref:Alkaline exonuclease n=1 Tax=Neodiprion abietis nucleopolyhedrovirus TaxID=204507 RepID=Q0ZP44_9CBAC|nr:alkaline exonuclease [Neodiprion abietis nucleopolyhedrovirus]ABC74910.1 alkaline exonuclease [Neodiprion abietis nucleopolyhedrovirus]
MEISENNLRILESLEFKNWAKSLRQLSDADLRIVEQCTRTQSANCWWHRLRDGRLTASLGKISKHVIPNSCMQYGTKQEYKINTSCDIQAYLNVIFLKLLRTPFKWQTQVGLHVSKYGYYCGSPDGIIKIATNKLYVVEIKNPSSYSNWSCKQILASHDKKNKKRDVSIKYTGLKLDLKTARMYINDKHEHWRQIQRQIYVTNAIGGLYVVGINSATEFLIVKVDRCDEFCENLRLKECEQIQNFRLKNRYMTFDNYVYEKNRFISFQTDNVYAQKLSFLGFFVDDDKIKCAFCNFVGVNTTSYRDILDKHKVIVQCKVNLNMLSHTSNVPDLQAKYPQYHTFEKRFDTFNRKHDCIEKAKKGLFQLDDSLICFTCGCISTDCDNHYANCKYCLYLDYSRLLI